MSENTGQNKTEQPTEQRLRKSREEGQVARSKELNTALLLLLGELTCQCILLLRILLILFVLLPAGAVTLLLLRLEGLTQFSLLQCLFCIRCSGNRRNRGRFALFRFGFLFSHALRR